MNLPVSEIDSKSQQIIEFVRDNPGLSSSEIHDALNSDVELITIKRQLSRLVAENLLATKGKGRGTKYVLSATFKLFVPIDWDKYFSIEQDKRQITSRFDFSLLTDVLPETQLFSTEEKKHLNELQNEFRENTSKLTPAGYKKELERLAIDLSWKSSQIEGNTYSLLETEQLLKENIEAKGKRKEEAVMLLNHKKSIDFLLGEPDYVSPLSVAKIENIHALLINDLGISANLRKNLVGITGTNYKPLENDFQIKEALEKMCQLVNERESVFEKALLILLLISYIQPFEDGNKRTARIVSNAVLMFYHYCPLSFRTVESIDYKKAVLLFYEQHNITAFKRIFMEQFEFAVQNYFSLH